MSPSFIACAEEALDAAQALIAGPVPTRPRAAAGVRWKQPHDYVTDLDVQVEHAIAAVIHAHFPGHRIAGEERYRADGDAGPVWHVDPIDGTRNLVAVRPEVAVCLGLYIDGVPTLGAIGLPCRGLQLIGQPDGGVQLRFDGGRQPLPPLGEGALDRALVGLPGALQPGHGAETVRAVMARLDGQVEGLRISGALGYDLACIALGELDARLSLAAKPVDVAAGVPLIHALGGIVTDLDGAPYRLGSRGFLAARSAEIHAGVAAALQAVSLPGSR